MARARFGWIVAGVAGAAVGVALGSFVTRTLYGTPDGGAIRPAPERPVECPPCDPCPVCPPPAVGEDGRLAPAADGGPAERGAGGAASATVSSEEESAPEAALDARDRGFGPGDLEPGPPGVSIATVRRAEAALAEALAPCRGGAEPNAVLQVTVSVTGTVGALRDAVVVRGPGDREAARACVVRRAVEARFPADGPEGRSDLKVPVALADAPADAGEAPEPGPPASGTDPTARDEAEGLGDETPR